MNWTPEDRFYPGYSLYNDIGYGPQGEKNLVRNQLHKYNLNTNKESIKNAMEITKEIFEFLNSNCSEEVSEYAQIIRNQKYIGGIIPIELLISKIIFGLFLEFIVTASFHAIKKLVKKFLNFLKKKKKENLSSEEEKDIEIAIKIVKEIQNNEQIVERLQVSFEYYKKENNISDLE
jgi:hypothetical protein